MFWSFLSLMFIYPSPLSSTHLCQPILSITPTFSDSIFSLPSFILSVPQVLTHTLDRWIRGREGDDNLLLSLAASLPYPSIPKFFSNIQMGKSVTMTRTHSQPDQEKSWHRDGELIHAHTRTHAHTTSSGCLRSWLIYQNSILASVEDS